MKKNMSKILSVVLVLVMVMSLSVTAFADGTTATIKVYNKGSLVDSLSVSAGTSVYAALEAAEADTQNTNITFVDWTPVTGTPNTHTPHYALTQINAIVGYAGSAEDLADEEGFEDVTNDDAVDGYAGYFLVDTDDGYHYVYVGYNWCYYTLNSSGGRNDIWLYMCDYYVSAGETVYVSFEKSVTDWTQSSPLGQ